MLFDIWFADYLIKKKLTYTRVIFILSASYLIFYLLLSISFLQLFSSFTTIIPSLIIFIFFYLYRIGSVKNHLKKNINENN